MGCQGYTNLHRDEPPMSPRKYSPLACPFWSACNSNANDTIRRRSQNLEAIQEIFLKEVA
jgi:hypothetical protein